MRQYTTEFKPYYSPNNIFADCNSITFINTGNVITYINGMPLFPNQSITIDGNESEIDTTNYQFWFATTNLPATPSAALFVVRKFFHINAAERKAMEAQIKRELTC